MKQNDFIRERNENGEEVITVANHSKYKLDLWPRLICLLLALIFWLYVVNINDTDVTATITVRLDISGMDDLAHRTGLLVYGVQKTEITLVVKGSNRDIKKYSSEDYSAFLDVSSINSSGKHTVEVKPNMPVGSSLSVVSIEPQNITLYADESVSKVVPLNVITGNITTVSAYEYSITKSADNIQISGPKSIVDNISSALYRLEGEFYSSKSFTGFSVDFLDSNGDYVMHDNSGITYSTADITVRMNVIAQKSVPVTVEVSGSGSKLEYTLSQNYVSILGDPNALAQISEYSIHLSDAVAGRTVSHILSSESLPDNVELEHDGETITIYFKK